MKDHVKFISFSFCLFVSINLLSACNDQDGKKPQLPIAQVDVYVVKTEPYTLTTELPGRTNSYRVAEVRPQVNGIILKRNFIEGSDIKAGDSLYQIDPAPYQAAYDNAKASLVKALATANLTHLTVKRYQSLLKTHYISEQEYDQARASAQQADAEVASGKAAVESARINLAYTKVTSPISGRIGKSNVTEGALVTNGQAQELTTVQQLDPIYVDVTQSSNDLLALKQALALGTLQTDAQATEINLIMDNGQLYPEKGTLEFSDVTVDETTGSVTLRALFPNPQHQLLPGMFVRARIYEGLKPDAILIPQEGVTRTPRGDATVLLVNSSNEVESRTVVANQAVGNNWLISQGLTVGDKVIISGVQKVTVGNKVTVSTPAQSSVKQ
ncbi:efflux RND transporter periplasmic adaptor subunit [Buttiauxella sp. B2]|uniref:efflux RND transporter periplasmic adaptor subunit n=1 Tax=Buttiauxella sp. B2 TaxID=2587812 RepID=UPI001120BEED|nr:efflux RND transporter periplasmic adaptor subunit [Buttiauxella sp. B2]TNV17892.1 efflux RND transporter periplasmic adaptor subunit [Buttiauxella sp. B2]